SQDEIDALLTTVSAGDGEVDDEQLDDDRLRSIIAYDFKHPNRVSKDQIRTLENMHDNFAGHYGSTLSALLRTIADVDLVSVDQITYSEFIMSLVSPSCTYTYAATPLEGGCLVDYNPTLTFALIDRMFGGNGKILESDRELTGIERSVMGRLSQKLYSDLTRAWENIVKLEIEQKSFETNPQFIQVVPPGETVVVVSFQIKVFQSTGLLTLCYPYVSLEPIITKLSAQNWIDATKKKNLDEDRMINRQNLNNVDTMVTAELLMTTIKVREFLGLQPGDIVPSERKISEPIAVYVNKRRKYFAQPGLSGKKRAVQITQPCDIEAQET
ncbi:MAG: flagellar motor switch protein FliM, partial [candidate division Zixibacteria bacterium]|nr:flagellar motor switch protein FliM [candidate division Zixibacteria bacterium]